MPRTRIASIMYKGSSATTTRSVLPAVLLVALVLIKAGERNVLSFQFLKLAFGGPPKAIFPPVVNPTKAQVCAYNCNVFWLSIPDDHRRGDYYFLVYYIGNRTTRSSQLLIFVDLLLCLAALGYLSVESSATGRRLLYQQWQVGDCRKTGRSD
jgi:hypothetical protein